jgi:lipid-A-disaccharide synthase
MTSVMISCGEASGDLYAGALTREILAIDPAAQVFGFGGEQLDRAGAALVGDYRGISVTGLVEVIRLLPRTYAMYRRLVAAARERRPDVFVAIDFPDFNFRLAAAVSALGIPVIYYVGPQLWAWRPGRLKQMKRFVDDVLVIFPFEEEMYCRAGVRARFVGHPLIDLVTRVEPRETFLPSIGLWADAPTVALLPGSRANEVRLILPVLADAAWRILADAPGTQFVLARAPHLNDALFAPFDLLGDLPSAHRDGPPPEYRDEVRSRLERAGLAPPADLRSRGGARPGAIVEGRTDAVLAASDVVLTASGTATVQTALHERPMVIVYKLSPLTYRLGRRFVRVDTFGMVNLVAGRRVVPELIQDDFTAEAVSRHAVALLRDPAARERMQQDLRDVTRRLGGSGASRRAAEAVLEVARRRRGPGATGS